MKEERVSFKNSKGQKLCGLLAIQPKKAPMIVMVHGMGPFTDKHEYETFDFFVPKFHNAGFSTLRFDFAGHGESDGEHVDVTLPRYVDDLKNAIDFARKQKPTKLGILADSFGCVVTIALNDSRVTTVILNSPPLAKKQTIERVYDLYNSNWRQEAEEKGYFDYKRLGRVTSRKVGTGLRDSAIKSYSYKDVSNINVPVLITSGDKDAYVPSSEIKDLFSYANEPKKLIYDKDAEHCFHNKNSFIIKQFILWFERWL